MPALPASLAAGRRARTPHFHGDCDVAAMVYGRDVTPDALLASFIDDLLGQGFDVRGVVQARPAGDSRRPGGPLFKTIPASPCEAGPRRDPRVACGTTLLDIGAWLAAGLRRRPDLVVLNRFGSQELAGSGLVGALAEAIERDVPVLIAVPEALFPRWLALARGLAVRLAADRASLDAWWRSLGKAGPQVPGTTFCGRFK